MQCLQQCSAVPTVLYLEERMITKEAVMNNLNTGRQQAGGNVRPQAGSRISTMSMVQVAIFGAIICIMAFTPFLGYIPLGFTRATIIHVPVIVA